MAGLPVVDPRGRYVVLAGDWHGNIWWARGVVERAARAGVHMIWQLGDAAFRWPAEGGRFDRKVDKYLGDNDVELIWLDGNHDSHTRLRKLECDDDGFAPLSERNRYAPRGLRFMANGRQVGVLGGAFSVDRDRRREGMTLWADLEEPTQEDIEQLGDDPLDVLLTHEAPTGVQLRSQLKLPDDVVARANNSRDLVRQAVERTRPALLAHGHWHQRLTSELIRADGGVTRVESLAADDMPRDAVLLDLKTLHVGPLPKKMW
ncbi:metallophosphoesterase family protein [Georgenia sp. SUBG003]|uniref:metallophosphoesterase family protein n=1 Tax=Georgenia sp. SUBG003 TaxID=1497974 RepID=UPI0004D80047|nr:hypothetical protein DA06_16920 [Georgenia sp. SUBG003]